MKPYIWLSIAALLSLTCTTQAQPQLGPRYMPMPYAAAPGVNRSTEAAETLREGIDKLLEFLGQDEKPNKLQVAAFLDATIAPYFDFDYMAKWIAGSRFRDMSAKQRQAFVASLEARFLGTLATKLANYKGQQVRFFRPRRGARGAVNVTVGIMSPGSYPSKLEFRMYKSSDRWKIYDVVANGRSAVAFYRQQSRRSSIPNQPGPYGR